MTVFVDTYAFLGWINPNDSAYPSVSAYLAGYRGRFVTTDWILMEVADALAKSPHRPIVVQFIWKLRQDPDFDIVDTTGAMYQAGWSLFESYTDKDWSLTDCISFAVMRARNLGDALTADRHFVQAGFRAVFRDAV